MRPLGRHFKETMAALTGYRDRITEYIVSQKDAGYILLIPGGAVNTVSFQMGQDTFVLQLNCQHHISTIYFKTFIKSKAPERENYMHVPEMDIVCEGVDERYTGIATFKVEKVYNDGWGDKKISQLQDFSVDYFFYLDRYVRSLYEPGRK